MNRMEKKDCQSKPKSNPNRTEILFLRLMRFKRAAILRAKSRGAIWLGTRSRSSRALGEEGHNCQANGLFATFSSQYGP